jgi:hypothetical protein
VLDLFVEFDALIAHRTPFELRTGATLIGRLIFKRLRGKFVHVEILEQFNWSGCGLCFGVLTGPAIKR